MKRVLVLGANGLFGHRLGFLFSNCNKITENVEVITGCRTMKKAEETVKSIQEYSMLNVNEKISFVPYEVGDLYSGVEHLEKTLLDVNPFLVINTAGPFTFTKNNEDNNVISDCYIIPKTCALHGKHYIDLADEIEYLQNFHQLNELAKENNVLLLAGASTTPGVTMSIISELSKNMDTISNVEWALSPGNRIGKYGSGSATVKSILRDISKPPPSIPFAIRHWSELKAYPFRWIGSKRHVARVNQIDLDLVNKEYSSNNSIPVHCYAGLESGIMTYSLGVVSYLFKFIPSLYPLITKLSVVGSNIIRNMGSDRGGFSVTVNGISNGKEENNTFDLLAYNEAGPFIPIIAAYASAVNILNSSSVLSGAFICGTKDIQEIFSYNDFINVIKDHNLCLYHSIFTNEYRNNKYLYKRLLGSRYSEMPQLIQDIHMDSDTVCASGTCKVTRGTSIAARILGKLLRLPNEGNQVPVSVSLITKDNVEYWKRNFDGNKFETVQTTYNSTLFNGMMVEKIGPIGVFSVMDAVANIFANEKGLEWDVRDYRVFNGLLSLPMLFAAKSMAIETQFKENNEDYFMFDVKIDLPLNFGLLVHYKGRLQIENKINE